MGAQDDAAQQAARERGAKVLRDLLARAGNLAPAEVARRSQFSDQTQAISDQTVSNLLAARHTVRRKTLESFVTACLHRQDGNPDLPGALATPQYWKARFYDAVGRATGPETGLVRIGRPPGTADTFVQRTELAPVSEAVEAGQSVVLTQRERVLSGLGGVGKTQLAAHYVWQVWRRPELRLIIWASARDVHQVVTAYAQAAARLLGADAGEPERAAEQLMEWLSVTTQPWLIVLDDVQLPTEVLPWWPEPTEAGQVIVTTRYRDEGLWRAGRRVIEVGMYTPEQALTFLRGKLAGHAGRRRRSGPSTPPDSRLSELAEDLGRLPLALSHAAAYLLQEGMTVEAYRAEFAEYRTRLEELFPRPAEFPEPYPDPVETTWAISLDLASRLMPGGVVPAVMLLASLLDPAGMPRDLFTAPATLTCLEEWLGRAVRAREVRRSLRVLHRLNLVTDDQADQWREVKAHALVQRASREAMQHDPAAAQPWDRRVRAVADAVVDMANKSFRPELEESLRHNARAVIRCGGDALWQPDGHTLLYGLGESLGRSGHVHAAADHFRELAATAAERLGARHRDTFLARGRHAVWLSVSGRPALAAEQLRTLIAERTRTCGEDEDEALDDWGNFAAFLGEAGDTAAALREFERLVERRGQVHGPHHRKTLVSRGNLARWRGENGDIPGAIQAFRELVPLFERECGPDDEDTLTARGNLGSWVGEVNPRAGLVQLSKLLPIETRVLGVANSHTLSTRRNIAMLLGKAGHVQRAITEFTVLIDDYEKFLHPDHPQVLAARGDLVDWLVKARELPVAHQVLRGLLADQDRVLGADHPDTARTRDLVKLFEKRS
ncbi:tetratricopeptide repeat protein [Streptomyces puniciscabiei]|uniref:Tetratricopeptide repeat protein n=1 Tax=Streptomyces puniciscabiei TaxID=164348 RepID=A0A542TI57_9ACTN|nr:tetratricopeptide repeat protein [Streptomyces puniciscabiei]TQK86524.1 tetratricopeptide repeat protein [Streptomyces puniciscabiei]